MKLAIIGSRSLMIENMENYIPENTDEIVSGGAKGIDSCAKEYAIKNSIILTEFLPEYSKYGKLAPLKRNEQIAEYADEALVFWDGHSKGTQYTVKHFEKLNKKITVIKL